MPLCSSLSNGQAYLRVAELTFLIKICSLLAGGGEECGQFSGKSLLNLL